MILRENPASNNKLTEFYLKSSKVESYLNVCGDSRSDYSLVKFLSEEVLPQATRYVKNLKIP